jgi:uncharacterized membrane protein
MVNLATLTEPFTTTSFLPVDFLYPRLFWLAIPLLLFLLWLTRHSFVKDNPRFDDDRAIRRRAKLRWTVFWLRAAMVVLLVTVLATPLSRQTTIRPGDLHLTVLLDESESMDTLDTSRIEKLVEELRTELPVTVRPITPGERSPLGDAILANIKPGENLLLVTDGHVTHGQDLTSVLSFAAQANSTVSAVRLRPRVTDAAIRIETPSKAIADTNTSFTIFISATEPDPVTVRVTVDGVVVFEERTAAQAIPLVREFSQGRRQIVAELVTEDANPRNNRAETLLWVVEKPAILVVTRKSSALSELFNRLYTTTIQDSLPTDPEVLKQYYGIVLIDLPISSVAPAQRAIAEYLFAGNGLLVVGGPNSYEYGGYGNTPFETLLPVTVGKGSPGRGITNIVLSLDMSSALEGSWSRQEDGHLVYTKTDGPALSRSLGASVLNDLDPNHNVGAVVVGASAANTSQNIVRNQYLFWDYIGGRDLGRVSTLGNKREELQEAISRIRGGGQAPSPYWLAAPIKAMENVPGAKNIIVVTDGFTCRANCLASNGGSDEETTLNLARTVAAQGGKVYVVGVLDGVNEEFLARTALAGNGIYFSASERNKLRILFSDPDERAEDQDAFALTVLNRNHFITNALTLTATLFGYNEVVPKPYARLLVTAGTGQPALTVWNYGVGRVGSLTTYNGEGYGDLTARGNSLLLSRTGNWIVGDPERKQETVIEVPLLYTGEEGTITVTSSSIPDNAELRFVPRGDDRYEAAFTPSTQGFGTVGGIPYAATYPREYTRVGQDPSLEAVVQITNGRLYDTDEAAAIAENVRTVRKLQETRLTPWRAPLLLAVAVLFVLEVAIRRMYEVIRSRHLS